MNYEIKTAAIPPGNTAEINGQMTADGGGWRFAGVIALLDNSGNAQFYFERLMPSPS